MASDTTESLGCLGGLFFFALVVAGSFYGFLIVTSQAVLYKEEPTTSGSGFLCSYYTGTRTVQHFTMSSTGCARLIKVGE